MEYFDQFATTGDTLDYDVDGDLACGPDAFERERISYHNGRFLPLTEVSEITFLTENEIQERISCGDLPVRYIGGRPRFHENDVRLLCQTLRGEMLDDARRAKVATTIRERHQYRHESGAVGGWELRTCPMCGTLMEVRGPEVLEIHDLEYWSGSLMGWCMFCGEQSFFTSPPGGVASDHLPF